MTLSQALHWADAHSLTLLLLIPLLGGALGFLSANARASWVVALLSMIASLGFAANWALSALFRQIDDGAVTAQVSLGPQVLAAPLVALGGLLAVFAAGDRLESFPKGAAPISLTALMVGVSSLQGAIFAENSLVMFVSVQAAWLSSVCVALMAAERERDVLRAGFGMLISGGVAASLMLVGVASLAASAGTFEFAGWAAPGAQLHQNAAIGVSLMVCGLALMAGLPPLGAWLGPAVGAGNDMGALALLAVTGVGMLMCVLRLAVEVLPSPVLGEGVSITLIALGAASAVAGSMQALGAVSIWRLGAYASIAQAGCVLISAGLGSPAGFAAALVQVVALAASVFALFGGLIAIGGDRSVSSMDGRAGAAPFASAAVAIGLLSAIGAPLTIGFLGRWRVVEASVGGGWWWAACAVIGTSLAAVVYAGRIIERLYFRKSTTPIEGRRLNPRWILGPAIFGAMMIVALGVWPNALLAAADAAAALAVGQAP